MSVGNLLQFSLIAIALFGIIVPSLDAQEQQTLPPVNVIRQWANEATASDASDGSPPNKVIGQPDSFGCGDTWAGWASNIPEKTTLSVFFPEAVVPTQINVYESMGAGTIHEIGLIPLGDDEVLPLPASADAPADCVTIFSFNLPIEEFPPVKGIQFTFTQMGTQVSIDAVELVGIAPEIAADLYQADLVVYHQWANEAEATSQYTDTNWSAAQATGAPDTFMCGDIATAWASRSSTSDEQLVLKYAQPVVPVEIRIRQTYNPGAIIRVTLLPSEPGDPVFLPDSADPGTECPGNFVLSLTDISDMRPMNAIIISLDQVLTGSWNEIDAVELIGLAATD